MSFDPNHVPENDVKVALANAQYQFTFLRFTAYNNINKVFIGVKPLSQS